MCAGPREICDDIIIIPNTSIVRKRRRRRWRGIRTIATIIIIVIRAFLSFSPIVVFRDDAETPNKSTGVVAQIKSIRRRLRRVCRSGIQIPILYYCICTRCYCTRLIHAFTFIAFFHDLWFFGSPAAACLYIILYYYVYSKVPGLNQTSVGERA